MTSIAERGTGLVGQRQADKAERSRLLRIEILF